jgi:hypothetical protein
LLELLFLCSLFDAQLLIGFIVIVVVVVVIVEVVRQRLDVLRLRDDRLNLRCLEPEIGVTATQSILFDVL